MRLYTRIPNASSNAGDYLPAVGWRRYWIGVDLAAMHDYTAICIIEDECVPLPRWGDGFKQLLGPRTLRVRQAFRLRKGMPYPEQVDFLARLIKDPAFEDSASLWIDQTGAGRAVSQLMDDKGILHTGVVITSGDSWRRMDAESFGVSKQYLLNKLNLAFATGEIEIAQDIVDAEEMKKQLADFQVELTKAGNMTMNASAGQHDDQIIALAIAYFGAKHDNRQGFTESRIRWG